MIKKILSLLIIIFLTATNAFAVVSGLYLDTSLNKIDAERNAHIHNNTGLMYMQEGFYYGAIKEFKLAIDLNPNTQATAVYYSNLVTVSRLHRNPTIKTELKQKKELFSKKKKHTLWLGLGVPI